MLKYLAILAVLVPLTGCVPEGTVKAGSTRVADYVCGKSPEARALARNHLDERIKVDCLGVAQ